MDKAAAVLPTRNELHLVRKLWHLLGGLGMVYLYACVLTWLQAMLVLGSVFALFFVMEVGRRRSKRLNALVYKLWKPMLRRHEVSGISGTFWYIAGCFLVGLLFPRVIVLLAVLNLAVGDPLASAVGIITRGLTKFGRLAVNNKSLLGTAFAIAANTIAAAYLLSLFSTFPSQLILYIGLISGTVGAIAEVLPVGIDDNFVIPVVSAVVMWLVFNLLAIPQSLFVFPVM